MSSGIYFYAFFAGALIDASPALSSQLRLWAILPFYLLPLHRLPCPVCAALQRTSRTYRNTHFALSIIRSGHEVAAPHYAVDDRFFHSADKISLHTHKCAHSFGIFTIPNVISQRKVEDIAFFSLELVLLLVLLKADKNIGLNSSSDTHAEDSPSATRYFLKGGRTRGGVGGMGPAIPAKSIGWAMFKPKPVTSRAIRGSWAKAFGQCRVYLYATDPG